MHNIMKLITTIIATIICCFTLSGCNTLLSDDDIAKNKFHMLLSNIEKKEVEGTKRLFAENEIKELNNFDETVNNLFDYYKGSYDTHKSWGLGVENDRHNKRVVQIFDMSYDVVTTDEKYRLAIPWCIEDTSDSKNIGICSLSILKFEDPNQTFAYRGNESGSYGIIIGNK